MYIALAPFTLKPGVSEETLLKTSDAFEDTFVQNQEGIHRRILVRVPDGGYADIVFFSDHAAMERVMEAEQNSDDCAAFFSLMDDVGAPRVFEVLKSYE
ncbi:hypothetical protein [Streptomyces cupreus]|uniref:ABM domain-containing protein n=1 Tax=Streptomyces cupreus TaxID=2759956 RepID=A0A7X1MDK0_9ACTN|nr:hypothetical protein [Streptomyces cupreus]MBC2904810.1 hypothetical protein [Streptomyces cupreus]